MNEFAEPVSPFEDETARQRMGRDTREAESREATKRPVSWQPAAKLPEPRPQPGWVFRWVRVSSLEGADPGNLASKAREGWVPCKVEDHPEFDVLPLENKEFADHVVIKGLMLCKLPEEIARARSDYYQNETQAQSDWARAQFKSGEDYRMPFFVDKKSTLQRVNFGQGR